MSEAEREKYVEWWFYESRLDLDELLEIATMLAGWLPEQERGAP